MSISSKSLVSGRDFPRTWDQFLDWFPDNAACLRYLEKLRWPDGFVCPRCGGMDEPYRDVLEALLALWWLAWMGFRHSIWLTQALIVAGDSTQVEGLDVFVSPDGVSNIRIGEIQNT